MKLYLNNPTRGPNMEAVMEGTRIPNMEGTITWFRVHAVLRHADDWVLPPVVRGAFL